MTYVTTNNILSKTNEITQKSEKSQFYPANGNRGEERLKVERKRTGGFTRGARSEGRTGGFQTRGAKSERRASERPSAELRSIS
jgi:hypothetical protein